MNIMITGGNGKLGQNIVERLQKCNRIFIVTRDIKKTEKIFNNKKNLYLYYCNLEKHSDIELCIQKIMKVNLFAPYFICQKVIPNMKQNKFGRIINISSDLSMRTVKNATEYSMTKAGLDALTRSIAVEYGEYGITANSININGMKGYTTKVNENIIFSKNDKDYDDWKQPKKRIPLSRRGDFSEFVDVIEFLCSDKSNYISGVNLPVDGGIIAKL